MAAGLIKTAGDLMGSTGVDHRAWCEQLLDFCCEDEQDRENSRDGYCFAWSSCFAFLRRHLPADIDHGLHLLFEYALPLHGGRRTDVVLLTSTQVVVLEFKATRKHQEADRLQAEGYVHYFKTSHAATLQHELTVRGYVVRTRNAGGHTAAAGVLDDSNFKETIRELLTGAEPATAELLEEWQGSRTICSPYTLSQINRLVREGARPEFEHLLNDGDISRSLSTVEQLIATARSQGQKLVIVVDGVPGSGKTYLGMKIAFAHKADQPPAIYVSGNGPLIAFLQSVFAPADSKDPQTDSPFIRRMLDLKREYTDNDPQHAIIVFDEAQRAWDRQKMGRYAKSEVEWLLQLGERISAAYGFCVLLCLFGTGQAIYEGEEAGLQLWQEALPHHPDWICHASAPLAAQLPRTAQLSTSDALHLTASLRSSFVDVSAWARAVIDSRSLDEQRQLYEQAAARGFEVRLLRHLEPLRQLRPEGAAETFGLLLSSLANDKYPFTADIRRSIGFRQRTEHRDAGAWFTGECRRLERYATEFVCQGLELDWPIIIFGGDGRIIGGRWTPDLNAIPAWKLRKKDGSAKFQDPARIVQNIYYVLLTRGRRGLILVIPEGQEFDETYEHFKQMGIPEVAPQQIWAMVQ